MINFTVGPVQSDYEIRKIGLEQIPYFRTPEFSEVMKENEKLILKFLNAPANSRAVFITGSGTASMEATVINILNKSDKVLIVNGGTFGQRFVDICSIHEIPFEQIKLPVGKALTKDILAQYENGKYTAFIVNLHETSTGVLYDIDLIDKFCKKLGALLIVDAISAFLADEADMGKYNIDAVITGSQKVLACPPGISVIALSQRALERVKANDPKILYLDLKRALSDGERGQTPFTPAVGILLQINARLKQIDKLEHGAADEIERVKSLAEYFRKAIKGLPFEYVSESPSNAVTALRPVGFSAYEVFTVLKDNYGIWICPNGGELKEKIFRVGHIGSLTFDDYDKLVAALTEFCAGKGYKNG